MRALPLLLCLTLAAPAQAGGRIEGRVSATPARYLADTVVYLVQVPGSWPRRTAVLDQRGMEFTPRILTIVAGDSVAFVNHDGVDHNVMSPDHEGYDLGVVRRQDKRTREFSSPGVYQQLCGLHPEMEAYIFVGQNPYQAPVDSKGAFVLHNVPPGTWELAVWNPQLQARPQRVTVVEGARASASFELHR